ncbi:N-6 DNA methylase [Burkholderia diffusa]|uniref:N-6 DNA methylase n=1 Tax=Burkholderia diffusa TaxID=488732 RepID=UPI0009BCBECC
MAHQTISEACEKGREFYTPKSVVQLVVEGLDPQPGISVYDTACGSGGMVAEPGALPQ